MGIQNRGLQRRFMGDKNVVCVAGSDCDTTRRNAARDAANKRYQNKDCKAYNNYREIIFIFLIFSSFPIFLNLEVG